MNRVLFGFILGVVFVLTSLNADLIQERRVLTSVHILKNALKLPKTGITKELLHNARAIAVFPNVSNGAFVVGSRCGDGVLSIKDENGKWSEPVFVYIKGASFGLQMGYNSSDIVVVFKTDRSLDDLIKGKLLLGVDSDIAVMDLGTETEKRTDEKLAANIKAFGRSRGVFLGASLSGTVIQVSDNDNFDYYGTLIYLDDIINGDKIKKKESSEKFKKVLYSF